MAKPKRINGVLVLAWIALIVWLLLEAGAFPSPIDAVPR